MAGSFMPFFVLGDDTESVSDEVERSQSSVDTASWNMVTSTSHTIEDALFNLLKNENNRVLVAKFLSVIRAKGILMNDPRLRAMMQKIQKIQQLRISQNASDAFNLSLEKQLFVQCISDCIGLIAKALRLELVIPNWTAFCKHVSVIYDECCSIDDGNVADHIPQASQQPQKNWGVAVCTIDGQRAMWGDYAVPWCVQSVCKPFIYGIALDTLGEELVHNYVGQEPSGGLSDDISLDFHNRPHNPMINAGTIVVLSLLKRADMHMSDCFEFIMNYHKRLSGYGHVGFSNTTYLCDRTTADRNFALAYYLREHKCFPENTHISDILDLYFQVCSIEVTCESAAVMAATLANGGVCPITGETIFCNQSVRDVLTLMFSCGMYDYSGQFAFQVGLPAKSAISGGVILVVPNVMGFAIWSPPLDQLGNTVRGVTFSKKLVERFNFHNYDSLVHGDLNKIDPRKKSFDAISPTDNDVFCAAASGDLEALKCFLLRGIKLNVSDYDGRTPLHLASSEGHAEAVKFLLKYCGADPNAKDRWGRTPMDDANEFAHVDCAVFLEMWKAKRSLQSSESVGHSLVDKSDTHPARLVQRKSKEVP